MYTSPRTDAHGNSVRDVLELNPLHAALTLRLELRLTLRSASRFIQPARAFFSRACARQARMTYWHSIGTPLR